MLLRFDWDGNIVLLLSYLYFGNNFVGFDYDVFMIVIWLCYKFIVIWIYVR